MLSPHKPLSYREKTARPCGIFPLIWSQKAVAPPTLTSGPSGFTHVILDFKFYYALLLIRWTLIIKMQLSILAMK